MMSSEHQCQESGARGHQLAGEDHQGLQMTPQSLGTQK